jgi:peptidoglycan/LPS O-acetylase OafA/YrhL
LENHRNNIGVLRLVLASLVIIGHAPEQIDGNRAREPLTRVFHSISLGELAVDGFFLVSGYLITASALKSKTLAQYGLNRVLRIYPAFIVASLLSVFVLGPIVGAHPLSELPAVASRMATLQPPPVQEGQLPGIPLHNLNAAMWTIVYEFLCYVMIGVFRATGVLNRRVVVLAIFGVSLVGLVAVTFPTIHLFLDRVSHTGVVHWTAGNLNGTLRLTSIFLGGSVVYLYREALLSRLNGVGAGLCAAVAVVGLIDDPHLAEAILVLFGAPALFWLALKADLGRLQAINDRWDISYGVYLYGWPCAMLILYLHHDVSPLALALFTLMAAGVLGAASWWLVEKWTKDLARRRPSSGAATSTSSSRTPSRGSRPQERRSRPGPAPRGP